MSGLVCDTLTLGLLAIDQRLSQLTVMFQSIHNIEILASGTLASFVLITFAQTVQAELIDMPEFGDALACHERAAAIGLQDIPQRQPVFTEEFHDSNSDGRSYTQFLSWGVGYFDAAPVYPDFAWPRYTLLPLYSSPDGEMWGWMACGKIVAISDEIESARLDPQAMIVTGASTGFVVNEIRDDGWFEFQYADPSSDRLSRAWTHSSHLIEAFDSDIEYTQIRMTSWEEHYLVDVKFAAKETKISFGVIFRNTPRPNFYFTPSVESLIEDAFLPEETFSYSLNPLEIRGEWMKVRLFIPSNHCIRIGNWSADGGRFYDVWIIWRTAQEGSLLDWPSRGC